MDFGGLRKVPSQNTKGVTLMTQWITLELSKIGFGTYHLHAVRTNTLYLQSQKHKWSSCNLQFLSELITTQLRISHGVTANSLYLNPLHHAILQVLHKWFYIHKTCSAFLVISGTGYPKLDIFGYPGTRKQFCKKT